VEQKAKNINSAVDFCKRRILKYVKDFKIINDRICYWRLKAKWFDKCTSTNKQKNGRGKRRILLFIRAKYKSNS
jgi:hypothetical protein